MAEWYNDFTSTSLGSETLASRKFLELFADIDDKSKVFVADEESFVVPSSGLWALQFCIAGIPTNTSNFKCSSETGGTGTIYSTTYGVPTSSHQIQSIPFESRLRFHSSLFGSTVYVNYKTNKSSILMSDYARLYNKVVALQSSAPGISYQIPPINCVCGETIAAPGRFVYISDIDNKCYKADVEDYTKLPIGWLRSGTTGSSVSVEIIGVTDSLASLGITYPFNSEIYCGLEGIPTFSNDNSAYALVASSTHPIYYKNVIGKSINGTTIIFNCLNGISSIITESS